MPRLLLINGPPGSGKSTLARRYVDDHPLALALDIDLVRGLLGRWQETPTEAGLAARRLAITMARVHLTGGHDVVIPQLLARPEFLGRLDALATEIGVRLDEVVLLDDWDSAVRRLQQRNATMPEQERVALPTLRELYDRLVALLPDRPSAVVMATHDGDPERTYRALLRAVPE